MNHHLLFLQKHLAFPCYKNKHFMWHNKLLTRDGIQKSNINDMAELMILFFTKSTEIIEVMLIRGVSTSIVIRNVYHQSRYYFYTYISIYSIHYKMIGIQYEFLWKKNKLNINSIFVYEIKIISLHNKIISMYLEFIFSIDSH